MCIVDSGRITTNGSCTCCSSMFAAVNCSHISAMRVALLAARLCFTPQRSSWRWSICTRSVSSTATSSQRTCCSTGKVTSNSPTSDSPRNSKTGAFSYHIFSCHITILAMASLIRGRSVCRATRPIVLHDVYNSLCQEMTRSFSTDSVVVIIVMLAPGSSILRFLAAV